MWCWTPSPPAFAGSWVPGPDGWSGERRGEEGGVRGREEVAGSSRKDDRALENTQAVLQMTQTYSNTTASDAPLHAHW